MRRTSQRNCHAIDSFFHSAPVIGVVMQKTSICRALFRGRRIKSNGPDKTRSLSSPIFVELATFLPVSMTSMDRGKRTMTNGATVSKQQQFKQLGGLECASLWNKPRISRHRSPRRSGWSVRDACRYSPDRRKRRAEARPSIFCLSAALAAASVEPIPALCSPDPNTMNRQYSNQSG